MSTPSPNHELPAPVRRPWRPVWGILLGAIMVAAAGFHHFLELTIIVPADEPMYHREQVVLAGGGIALILTSLLAQLVKGRERDRLMREIVEHSSDVFFAFIPGAGFTYISPQVERVLGHKPERLRHRWGDIATTDPMNERESEMVERALETGHPQGPYEMELQHANGHSVPVEVREAPVIRERQPIALVGCLTDLTDIRKAEAERRTMEDQLRQTQKMEAVGKFTAGVAHDFNNHLTAILSSTEVLREQVDGEGRELVRDIEVAGQRSAELIAKLMAFSRQQPLSCKTVDLRDLLEEYRDLVRRLLPTSIQLEIVPPPRIAPVQADRTALGQILLNLASNARDAMDQEGVIRIEVRERRVTRANMIMGEAVEPGLYVALTVTDDGRGMPPGVQRRAFDPFFTTKQEGRGTGMGLATVHGLARQHGGHVRVESAEGLGTTIEVLLPAAPSEAEEGEEERGDVPAPANGPIGLGILLVDDDESVRRATQRILTRAGATVRTAGDGREALSILADHEDEIELVITDLVMPGMGGAELAEKVAESHPGIPFLFVTGYSPQDAMPSGAFEPAHLTLRKPWTTHELTEAITNVTDLSSRTHPTGASPGPP